jgi:DMSO/TMAO reductase YedYZ molybdopterin-dependent catalytic subunit
VLAASTAAATTREPENVSYPLGLIEDRITPANRFFVRDHFAPPEIELASWKLNIEGRVEQPYEITFSDLLELPGRRLEAVLECAGNVAAGFAVSDGVWEGVALRELLQRAKPAPGAAFLLLEGADTGRLFENHPQMPYARLVPIQKCLQPESLVAFKLNGQTLPARNGFPARAIFPGCYGMDSVKWLRRMVVIDAAEAQAAYAQSGMDRLYTRVAGNGDSVRRLPLASTQIKSVISWPGQDVTLPLARHTIWGFAWGGAGRVREVLVSTEGGKTWREAKFTPAESQYAWVRWTFDWDSSPGDHVILSRASDESGARQPLSREPQRKDQYELNWCSPVRCNIR